jgi:vacuolar-type H+-ATPase subunit E/Vma4
MGINRHLLKGDMMEELVKLVEEAKTEYEKFTQTGNKSAGTRARGALQKIKSVAQDLRKEIQAKKNA